jgi:hypothetical protein
VTRSARRPLRIEAHGTAGSWQASILISRKDARKIQRDPAIGRALRSSTVTVVTDPLIG